ncbi:hypothetical protein OAF00_01715, partial [bacterium]|nr:hypothetical protein [bacterium]
EGNRLHDARRRAGSGNTYNGAGQQSYAEQHAYNQLQITKIIIRGMGQVTSNKNDTQSENQVVLFLVRSLESAMAFLSINRDRFSSVFVRKTRSQPTHTVSFFVSARKVKVKVRRFIPHKSKSLYFLTKNGDGGGKWMCSTTVAIYT